MPLSSYTHTDTLSRMLSQEHYSLLLQSWQSSEKSSLLVSLHGFYMINNVGIVVISTVFGTPKDLSHIFCHTSVNIYCGDSAWLSAVIVNLPSLCLLTDESDPVTWRCKRERWRVAFVCCVCSVCVCEWWLKNFLQEPQGQWYSQLSHYARVCPVISFYPIHTLKNLKQTPHTQTRPPPSCGYWLKEGMERTERRREGYGGRLWMRWGDVKVVRGQPGAATICGYIFSPEPLNVWLALGLSAAFWCG